MNLNRNLESFLNSQIFDEDYGTLCITLPLDVHQYVESSARKYAKVNRMISTQDIIENWGSVEKFQEWKSDIVDIAQEMNFNYLMGLVDGLIALHREYHQNELHKGIKNLENIDARKYVQSALNIKFNTDSE